MNCPISDRETRFSRDTLAALSFGGVVENRLGYLFATRQHIAAVRKLTRNCCIIQAVRLQVSSADLCVWICLGLVAYAFLDVEAFDFAAEKLFGVMGGMWRRVAAGRGRDELCAYFSRNPEASIADKVFPGSCSYLQSRSLLYCFIGTSLLRARKQ
jgi:hypothetical protein